MAVSVMASFKNAQERLSHNLMDLLPPSAMFILVKESIVYGLFRELRVMLVPAAPYGEVDCSSK